jgi:hypothetical protein
MSSLLDCGVARVMCTFLSSCFDMLGSVMRLGLITVYGKEYKQLLGCMDSVWACLVSSRHYKVYEEIIDAAVMQRLVEEWLPSKVNLSVPTMGHTLQPTGSPCSGAAHAESGDRGSPQVRAPGGGGCAVDGLLSGSVQGDGYPQATRDQEGSLQQCPPGGRGSDPLRLSERGFSGARDAAAESPAAAGLHDYPPHGDPSRGH